MAGLKILRFLGTAPKVSPELLPDTAAQIARNCKLYSGDLLPYPQPVVAGSTNRTGTIHTLYALRDPVTSELKWLSWAGDVNIAIATPSQDDEQRFYYTGDGAPKVSNYELATGGATPYPVSSYDLGLPVPPDSSVLTTVAGTFTTVATASYARDSGNTATIVTSSAHNLRTGNSITVAGFTHIAGTYSQTLTTIVVTIVGHGLSNGASVTLDFTSGTAVAGTFTISYISSSQFSVVADAALTTSGTVNLDLRSFNATSVECTVVDSTTIKYFSPGFPVATTSYTTGTVDLGGLTQTRSYVFTWYTPWDEESIASKPSDNLYIKEGVTVTVSNLPTAKPTGSNFVRGVRLYRTLASTSGTEYYRLATLWFPIAVARVQRTSNVSRVETTYPHNLDIDGRFKLSGCTNATFNITGGIVTDVLDDYTFEYAQVAGDVADTAVAAGTVYHDVSENPPTSTARYWGDGSYDFVDDFDSKNLLDILGTDEYDAPPSGLQGLVSIQNTILAGFVGNQLFFSEKAVPHAWPREYTKTIEHNIVGLAVANGSVLVLTEGYPYVVTGSDPQNLSIQRVDALYPCLNRSSIVTMDYGVVYSTHDGLAVFSVGSGPQVVTKALLNNDTWNTAIDPTTITASYYGENYFASHSTGAFVFERDDQIGGFFVSNDFQFTAAWYDSLTGKLYVVSGDDGDIYEWDNLAQPLTTMEWKSKVIVTKDMLNLGAARVVADYVSTTEVWESGTSNWETSTLTWSALDPLEFKLWVDKQLVFTTDLTDSSVFRLPTGFRSDTYEVGISGNIRVRSIHLAETPIGLKEI
jgi:hypothetical protein